MGKCDNCFDRPHCNTLRNGLVKEEEYCWKGVEEMPCFECIHLDDKSGNQICRAFSKGFDIYPIKTIIESNYNILNCVFYIERGE